MGWVLTLFGLGIYSISLVSYEQTIEYRTRISIINAYLAQPYSFDSGTFAILGKKGRFRVAIWPCVRPNKSNLAFSEGVWP